MRRQRFPFIISPYERKRAAGPSSADAVLDALSKHSEAEREIQEKTSRVLASLSLIEASLDELIEKANAEEAWRKFFLKLIPILDGIDAVRRAIERGGDPSWKRGMEISSDKLAALLEAHGLFRAAQSGMTFDPSRHESVGACDSSHAAPGTVAEVVENGWLHRGEVLRYAKVIVAKGGS
jgi:molecular chaperone GrpE